MRFSDKVKIYVTVLLNTLTNISNLKILKFLSYPKLFVN